MGKNDSATVVDAVARVPIATAAEYESGWYSLACLMIDEIMLCVGRVERGKENVARQGEDGGTYLGDT